MSRIQTHNGQSKVTIPQTVKKQVGLEDNEEVLVVPDQYDKNIIIKRMRK